MDKDNKINKIGEIEFNGDKVIIYHDPYSDNKNNGWISWQARNPDSFYQGIVYMPHDGGPIVYPEDAVIPEQTEKDREIIPKYIITGLDVVNDDFKSILLHKIKLGHILRNNIRLKRSHKALMIIEASYIYSKRHDLDVVEENFIENVFLTENFDSSEGSEFDNITKDLRMYNYNKDKYQLTEITLDEYTQCVLKFGSN